MSRAYNVYLNGVKIDTVINCDDEPEDTRTALIADGYDPAITVEEYKPYESEDRHDR